MWLRITTRKTCHVFRTDWIAFVRHCWRPFWPFGKELFHSRCSDFWRPRISVAIRSIEVAMLARTAKYLSVKVTRKDLCRDFLSTDTNLSQTYFSTNGGMLAKLPTAPEILPASTPAAACSKRSMFRFISLYQVANLRPKLSAQHATPWVRPIMIVNLCSFALSAMMLRKFSRSLTDDVVGLFVEVTIGRIYHVSRSQTIVNPLALFAKSFRNRTCEGHHIVTSFLLDLKIRSMSKSAFSRIKATSSLGISPTQPMPHQPRFPPQPSTVFIFFSPNVRHFRARVTFDHVLFSLMFRPSVSNWQSLYHPPDRTEYIQILLSQSRTDGWWSSVFKSVSN